MAEAIILAEVDDRGIATVTLNRPDVHNALNDEVIGGLCDVFDDFAAREDLKALILTGRGKSFSAGADLNWMRRAAGFSYEENLADAKITAGLFHRLNTLPMPTIAKVQGSAFAGALGLIACCDIAVGAEDAMFAVTEARIGLIAAVISPYLIAAIGPGAARRYFQTAERFDAAEAKRIGLLHEVVRADGLDEAVERILRDMLKNAPLALRACKTLIRECAGPVTEATRDDTAGRIAGIRATAEGQEGIAAFFEKRKPNWSAKQEGSGQ
ncbi:MAG: enoyl-CoA hydratase/isomerase family protein [Alphaproteobacteria bacterium]|nr:enoyl-CoA hydratase/isomerase family protein [Alphaproteobacteria bacterium]